MIDVLATIRSYLAAQPPLTDLVSDRIYGSEHLPAGYQPNDGPAIVFNVRGGGQEYSSKVFSASLQFRSYAVNWVKAWEVSGALYDVFNDVSDYLIMSSYMETLPTVLTEPDTGWDYTLSFYFAVLRNP
jgi:hypothetical protein